jgi:hypothetical protein
MAIMQQKLHGRNGVISQTNNPNKTEPSSRIVTGDVAVKAIVTDQVFQPSCSLKMLCSSRIVMVSKYYDTFLFR